MIFNFVKWTYFDQQYVPYPKQWEAFNKLLTPQQFAEIAEYINQQINSTVPDAQGRIVFCTSWDIHPGKDWSVTPLDHLYQAVGNEDQAKLWYGQFVWHVVQRRAESFGTQRIDVFHDPEHPAGLHYFTIPPQVVVSLPHG